MRERRTKAEARWRGLVLERMESGKSVAAFCRERGVPASQMFSWKNDALEMTAIPPVSLGETNPMTRMGVQSDI